MNQGIKTIIYPVKDLAKAKALYGQLFGVQPYMDEVYYVGYVVGGQNIGLDPNGHASGMTGPVSYYHVDDIKASLQTLLDGGATLQQAVKDVGGSKLVATVTDSDNNLIGLLQMR